jgi:hypothetical protein
MATSEADLERPPGFELAANLNEVRALEAARPAFAPGIAVAGRARRPGGLRRTGASRRVGHEIDPWRGHDSAPARPATDDLRRLAQRRHADHLDATDQRRFRDGRRGNGDAPQPAPGEGRGHRQHPRDGPDLTAE